MSETDWFFMRVAKWARALIVKLIDEEPSYSLDELLAAVTPENLHGEISTGCAVGNEFS